jgi:putative addiction module component (TIGR02574 family)
MPTPAEEIETIALQLPRDQRAYLAERLIASLDDDADVEEAWAAEIRRRVAEIRAGAAETNDASEVFEELKDLYR